MSDLIKVTEHEYYDKMLFINDALIGMDTAKKMIIEAFEAMQTDNRSDFTDELTKMFNDFMSELIVQSYSEAENLKNDIFAAVDDFVKADEDISMKIRHADNIAVKYINITEGAV